MTLVAVGAAIGGALYGGDTSTLNGAIPGIRPSLHLTDAAVGLVAAIALLGSAVGAWFAGPLAARLGRTPVMGIGAALIAAGSLGASFSESVVSLVASRILVGLGIGAASAVIPAYIAEISPAQMRGRLGSTWQFAIVLGQFAGLLSAWAFASIAGGEAQSLAGLSAWRWMFVPIAAAAALFLLVARALPHSADGVVRRIRQADATDELQTDAGGKTDALLTAVRKCDARTRTMPGLRDLTGKAAGLRPIVWIGIALAVFQALLGITVVKTYSNTIWEAVGFGTESAFAISVGMNAVSVVAAVVGVAIVDRLPRRLMLGVGALVSAAALGALAWAFSQALPGLEGPKLGRDAGMVALAAMNLFTLAFGITWGPVMWVMLGELFDGNLRVSAVAVATALNWVSNWAVTRTFPLLAANGLGLAYGLYAGFGLLAALFVWKALPETRGRALS